ncbi:MAG: SpoIID/LytB domain-containing protein [bacterium]
MPFAKNPRKSLCHYRFRFSIRTQGIGILCLLLSFSLLSGTIYAATVRVLILDDTHRSIPPVDDVNKIGNLEGKLLFQGSEYSGRIEVFRGDNGLFVVNELPLEDYVKSVVKSEVGVKWPLEALKAQAVTVRTYAVYHMLRSRSTIFHLVSSTLSQVYKGANDDPEIERAVDATRGEILAYNGEPINALYHSTSGGLTELPEEVFQTPLPYLKSVKTECSSSPFYVWERRITKSELEHVLSLDNLQDIEVVSLTKTGRAKELKVTTNSTTVTMEAKKFRELLGWKRLPSTWFTIARTGTHIVFNGRGYGHGVGLCQWSASEMAVQGKSYREILSTFYSDTMIQLYEK